jgi:hypothetical protein
MKLGSVERRLAVCKQEEGGRGKKGPAKSQYWAVSPDDMVFKCRTYRGAYQTILLGGEPVKGYKIFLVSPLKIRKPKGGK